LFGQNSDQDFRVLLRGGLFRHAALVSSGGILVDEAFASGTIQQNDSGPDILTRGRAVRFLECGAKCGALGAIARHGCSGLTHVLLRGCDIRHYSVSIGSKLPPRFMAAP
jgi:hypothetical protein